jgi:NADPH:quinone reductase-like Zn-dependent oxidoreductase
MGVRAVQITRFGGPEVLDIVDLPDPAPGPGQQLYEVSAAGVNFADTNHDRSAQQTVCTHRAAGTVREELRSRGCGSDMAAGGHLLTVMRVGTPDRFSCHSRYVHGKS